LHEALVSGCVSVAAGFETKLPELRADVFSRDAFVIRAAAAALHRVARKKTQLGANVSLQYRWTA
jgi:hypothetical protein